MSEDESLSRSLERTESGVNHVIEDITSEDGRLAALLKNTLNQTVEKCLSSMMLSTFKEHYKEIDDKYPSALGVLHRKMTTQLHSLVSKEFEEIYEEENIVKLLNSLEDIIGSEPSDVQPAWRPSGIPEDDLCDHVHDIKLQHKVALESILDKLNSENEEISTCVQARHDEILKREAKNQSIIKEIEKITAVVRSDEMTLLHHKLNNCISSNAVARRFEHLEERSAL